MLFDVIYKIMIYCMWLKWASIVP